MTSQNESAPPASTDAAVAMPTKSRKPTIDDLRADVEVAQHHLDQCRLDEAGAIGPDPKREARLARVQAKIDLDQAKKALSEAEGKAAKRRTADTKRKREARSEEKRKQAGEKRAEDLAEKAEVRAYARARRDAEEENRLRDAAAKQAAKVNARAQQQQQGDAMLTGARDLLRSRFIYGAGREQWFDRETSSWRGPRAFDQIIGDQMPEGDRGRLLAPSTVWREMSNKPEVENERYCPGQDALIAEEMGRRWVNLWKPSTLVPVPGNVRPMLRHILMLTNRNLRDARIMLDWLAYGVQNPGKKIDWSILIVGPQGIGKDTLYEAMKRVYDGEDREEGNARIVENAELAKGRNTFVSSSQFVYVPEIKSDDRNGLGNILKTLITGNTATVDEKFVPTHKSPNRANFFSATNHMSAVPIEVGDRRYFVIICRLKPSDFPEGYFDRLYDYIRGDGVAGWAHYLATRDLSQFNPHGTAPETDDKHEVIAATANRGIQWLTQRFEEGLSPFHLDVVSIADAHETIAGIKGAPVSQISMKVLQEFIVSRGAKSMDRLRWTDLAGQEQRRRVWAIREAAWYATRPGKAALAIVGRFRYSDESAEAPSAEVIKPAAFSSKPSATKDAWATDSAAEAETAASKLLHVLNGLRFSIGLVPLNRDMAPADPAVLRAEIDGLRAEIEAMGEAS